MSLCKQLVRYAVARRLKIKQMGGLLKMPASRVLEIANYKIDRFTFDWLLHTLSILAYVAEDNVPSCKLLGRIGFIKEGVCREHYIINGKPTNEVLFGILRSDWERGRI
jgi:hypothetical protein